MARLLALVGATVICLVAAIHPPSFTVRAPGVVLPCREWTLVRASDGLASVVRDHAAGVVTSYEITTFERGDRWDFRPSPALRPGPVQMGDTLGVVVSQELERRRVQLAADLAAATGELLATEAGDRPIDVHLARLQLERARSRREWLESEAERLRSLATRDAIAPVDLDEVLSQLRLARIDEQIRTGQIDAARSGSREPLVALQRTRQEGIAQELSLVEARLQQGAVCAPLAGLVAGGSGADTLAVVQDRSALVVLVATPWSEAALLEEGSSVEVSAEGAQRVLQGLVRHRDAAARVLAGRPFCLVRVELTASPDALPSGMPVSCAFRLPDLPLAERLRRWLI